MHREGGRKALWRGIAPSAAAQQCPTLLSADTLIFCLDVACMNDMHVPGSVSVIMLSCVSEYLVQTSVPSTAPRVVPVP